MADLDTITTHVLDRASREASWDPFALVFLLRRYRVTGRQAVGDALGSGLAVALTTYGASSEAVERARWLSAFAEAATLSEDPRLVEAVRDLIGALPRQWPSLACVDELAASIDACLMASQLVEARDIVPRAIDELERVVAGSYRPGEGVTHVLNSSSRVRGGLADHARLASALLTAFGLSGRLPYSMLAEELMQASRDAWSTSEDVEAVCDSARVLCRLAALHDDAEYRRAAVIDASADYRSDAQQLLDRIAHRIETESRDLALYGIALAECRETQPLP